MMRNRTLLAFLGAPLGAVVVYAALFVVDPFDSEGSAYVTTMILLIVAAVGYAAELLVGVPGFLLLKRLGWLSSISVLVGATFVGVMVAFLLDLSHLNLARWHFYATCAGAGA